MPNFMDRMKNNQVQLDDNITLNDWLPGKSDEELRDAFISMDQTMKYIHDHGYFIQSFDPNEIEFLHHSIHQVKYHSLSPLPDNFEYQREIVRENIYTSSFLQIGIYTNCLPYMKSGFLKENFDSFATFLPEGDIPYYRGIIQRGASVYFHDYVKEKQRRDLEAMEKEFGSEASALQGGKHLVKSNGTSILGEDDTNKRYNDAIYSQLNKMSDAAYISFLVIPCLVAILGLVFTFIVWASSLG